MKIWCNLSFTPTQAKYRESLAASVSGYDISFFEPKDNGCEGESAAALQNADIAFGSPDPDMAMKCEKLKWIQLFSAGYTAYDRDDFREALTKRGVMFSTSSDVFVEPCAQHLLAMIMSIARGLPQALKAQLGDKAWPMHHLRAGFQLPNGQTALILGFGTIGHRLAELLEPLKMNLIGVKRTVRGGEPIKVIASTDVDEYLPLADHVINILPANAENDNFLNAERLGSLKPGAIFYNIGRGTTVDQNALMAELNAGRIAAAYLDVTDPEPLQPDHPLWTTANCFITPHIAGGLSDEKQRQIDHFLGNLKRFENGDDLRNRII